MAFLFQKYPAVHQAESGASVYADVINHCRDYRTYMVAGDRPSSAHECTHGANSDIRNSQGASEMVWLASKFGQERQSCGLPRKLTTSRGEAVDRVNAFYCLKDRAAVVKEPNFRKSDAAEFIPKEFRASRYSLYVAGQKEWDDCPLYIFDEWTAYTNGGMTAVEMGKAGQLKSGSDWVFGPIEFVAYGLAVCLAADKRGLLEANLAEFARFCLVRAFNVYLDGKALFPFGGQDDLYKGLQSGQEGTQYRDIMAKLKFTVPDRVQPENGSQPLDRNLFKVI